MDNRPLLLLSCKNIYRRLVQIDCYGNTRERALEDVVRATQAQIELFDAPKL